MSGSSLDGLDIVAAIFKDQNQYKILQFQTYKLDERLMEQLKTSKEVDVISYFKISADFSKFVAETINNFIRKYNFKPQLVCIHGHTVYHNPSQYISKQMIEGGIIASKTGIDCLVDFRIQDISSSGQGAPLAPIVEHLLGNHKFYINLGGIANISIHDNNTIYAYDIGPCNQLFNAIANIIDQPYDEQGKIGAAGQINMELLNSWLNNDYFNLNPPKSIDNSWLNRNFIESLPAFNPEDLMATAYEFVATIIYNEIKKFEPEHSNAYLTGGGTHNTFFVNKVKEKLRELQVDIIVPNKLIIDAKEALLMAYMGYLYIKNKPNIIPSVTGGQKSHVAGGYYKGSKESLND